MKGTGRGRLLLVRLVLVGAVLLAAGCGAPRSRRNVLLVTFDTTRADRIGCYGFPLARTPRLDRLAREGVRCTDAIAAAPITLPSHATILTGLHPPAHGVRDNGTFALGEKAVTLAERLKGAGYETQAFVSAVVLNRRYGLAQGFDGYDDDLWAEDAPKLFMIRERRAARTAQRFVEWLGRRDGASAKAKGKDRKPFFAWVHFFDPHQPLTPLAADSILSPTPYDAEIAAADRGLGALLDALEERDLLDDTLVVVTADHGESLGEHGEKTHAIFVYDATIRVPLVLRLPGTIPRGLVYRGPVRHVDVVPTVLSVLGLPGGGETQGVDLLPGLRSPPLSPRVAHLAKLPQYSESLVAELGFGMAPLQAIRSGGFKLIRAPRPELYDLAADPHETRNLLPGDERRAAILSDQLDRVLSDSLRFGIDSTGNPMSKETMETLVSLGYVAPSPERRAVQGMDPKDGLPIYSRLEEARHLAQRERWGESEKLLREILRETPAHVSARNVLGLVLVQQDRIDEARTEYLRSLRDDPRQDRVQVALGAIALRERNLAEAERLFRAALEINPAFVEAIANLGLVASLRGDEAGAAEWYAKALAADPGYPRAYRLSAELAVSPGEWGKALEGYREALARQGTDFTSRLQEGTCLRRLGDARGAEESFRKASRLRPDSWTPDYNLACLAASLGKGEEALRLLASAVAKGAPASVIAADRDLDTLRPLPAFAAVARKARPDDP